ncbi:BrnA antitoxin family protein [Sphaerotilus sp.]|uniref:BrnA antitoxin family protein n=1 Tax=Sphaerotilus sp. TaxID=2093942 RepID=UPI0025FCEA85|nr:BrnA antitoxin family protein [Sphaerotilus sp.]
MSIAAQKTTYPAIVMPTMEEDAAITAAALSDPDAQPLTDAQLGALVPMKTLRGRPRTDNPKRLVSVRYSPEVITYFKSTGDGWQARMDGVLREYVARQAKSTP